MPPCHDSCHIYKINIILPIFLVAAKSNKKRDPQTFFEKNNKEQIISNNTDQKYTTMYDENGVTHVFPWTYNDLFDKYDNLPPSIKRLKSTDFINLNISKWG